MQLRTFRHVRELGHLALRSSTLVLRFVLTFYIVKALGYEASGAYGLAVGAIGIVPAAVGWGLNYFTARDVIGIERREAMSRVKTRLLVTTGSLAGCTWVALVAMRAFGAEWHAFYGYVIVLIWLETYALDMHMPLLAIEKASEANILVFVRSALWVPVLIGLAALWPALRTLDTVFGFWIASHLLAALLLVYFLRRTSLRDLLALPVQGEWLRSRLRRSWSIYLSDISLVGTLYADRYVVSYLLGITVTGLYTFYWSLTNALQTLVTTAVVQVLFPRVYKSLAGGTEAFVATLRRETAKVAAICMGLGICLLAFGEVASRFLPPHGDIPNARWVFVLLTAAAMIRTVSEMLNTGLTTLRKDNHYALLNIVGVVLSLSLAYGLISALGFIGAGVASVATAVILSVARYAFLARFVARHEA